MKASKVTINCTIYAPGEVDAAPEGGCGCTVTATFPTGTVTRDTGVYASETFARGVAENIKHSLEKMEVSDERPAREQVALRELGY
jgi:hypothetical protein